VIIVAVLGLVPALLEMLHSAAAPDQVVGVEEVEVRVALLAPVVISVSVAVAFHPDLMFFCFVGEILFFSKIYLYIEDVIMSSQNDRFPLYFI
jgi:hypothetical protein